jgi:hypothetical protein
MNKTKFDKNAVYSVKTIASELCETFPGYFKNLDACVATIGPYIRKKGIKAVNEQSSWRVFSGSDAQRVFDHEAAIIARKTGKGTPKYKKVVEALKETPPVQTAIDEAIEAAKNGAQISIDDYLPIANAGPEDFTEDMPAPMFPKAEYFIEHTFDQYGNLTNETRGVFMTCLRDILLAED